MRKQRRHLIAIVGAFATVVATVAFTASPAHADGPTTFTNNAVINIPATPQASGVAVASPYPSPITVSGLAGPVSNVQVVLNGFSSGSGADVDLLLVSPDDRNLVLMSDIGGDGFSFASNAQITFSDSGGNFPASGNIGSGTYKPTDTDPGAAIDEFPSPAPTPSANTTLASAFTGATANGTWKLFAVDDVDGDTSSVSGGWSLTLTTTATGAATSTTLGSGTPNPSQVGSAVTFTANVSSGGNPVTEGTVNFSSGGTPLGSSGVNFEGVAQLTTSALSEGSNLVTATYAGTPSYLSSNASTTQIVDGPTTVDNGRVFCNPGGITIPGSGAAAPYASRITVSGVQGDLTSVRAGLRNVNHSSFIDLDVLLVAPGGQSVVLLSDAGGSNNVANASLTFGDGEPAVPTITSSSSGRYRPTDADSEGADPFPAPAPTPSAATTMASLQNSSPNGVWSLYVVDDATGDSGSIGSWCVRLVAKRSTTTALSVVPQTGPPASDRVLTATVSATGDPISAGQVDFYATHNGTRTLLGTQPVSNGTAQLTTSSLEIGTSKVRAFYRGSTAGASTVGASASPVVLAKVRPTAEANGPYAISPGQSLALSSTGSVPADATFAWDVNGDGDFTDATGASPTLTWSELQALGIRDRRNYQVRLRVESNGLTDADVTLLKVSAPSQ